jgi:hypothetical protein
MTAAEIDDTDAVLIGSRLSLRGHCRGSDTEQRRGNDQPVPGQHGLSPELMTFGEPRLGAAIYR